MEDVLENTYQESTRKSGKKLSTFTKVSYGLGDFASQLVWTFAGNYLSVFYTDVVGLAPAVASAIILFARIWDGVNDPMFGAIAERTHSKWGRFRPYILFGAPFLALFNVLCFLVPFGTHSRASVVWATATYIIMGMLYTAVNLSYGSLGNVLTYDPQERTELQSWRMIGLYLGSFILNSISMPLIMFFSGSHNNSTITAKGYTLTATVFACMSLPLFLLLFSQTKEVVKPVAGEAKIPVKTSLKVVLTNKPLLCIFFTMLLYMTANFGRIGLMVYYMMYVVKRIDLVSVVMMLPGICTACSIFVTKRFAEKIGKKRMIVIGFLGCASTLFGIYLTKGENIPALIGLTIIYGLFCFGTPVVSALVPEAVDYAEDKTGVRSDGISYAATSLATKFGSAFGASLGLLIMGMFGYAAGAEQTAQAVKGINIVVNLIPACLFVLALIPLYLYPLNAKKNEEIRSSLMKKAGSNS